MIPERDQPLESNRESMRTALRFFRHAIFVASPMGVVVAVAVLFGRWSGETLSASEVLDVQLGSASAVQPLYQTKYASQGQQEYLLKMEALRRIRPQIIVAGSSRALAFRTELLATDGRRAYNYGFAMRSLEDLAAFADTVVELGGVESVLLTVDRWWFRAQEGAGSAAAADSGMRHGLTDQVRIHAGVLRDVVRGAVSLDEIRSPRNRASGLDALGLGAIEIGGYRPDGSYCYANVIAARRRGEGYRDRNWRPHVVAAREHVSHFGPPYSISSRHRELFRSGLARLLNAGVEVAVVNPPYSTELWRVLNADPLHRQMTEAEAEVVGGVCAELGVAYFDARDLISLGLDNDWMVDGYHGGEPAYAVILRELWRDPRCPPGLAGCGVIAVERLLSASSAWELDETVLRQLASDGSRP